MPTRTAILADDEPLVRAALVRALQHLGFAVLAAADGHEALGLARGHDGPIHLLVTDIDMPGLTGAELARAVRGLLPDTPVLFTSGRPAPCDLADAVVGRTAAFLAKPITLDGLRDAVAELAGSSPRPEPRYPGRSARAE